VRKAADGSAIHYLNRQADGQTQFYDEKVHVRRLAAHLDVARVVYTTLGRRRMDQSSTILSDRQTEYYDAKNIRVTNRGNRFENKQELKRPPSISLQTDRQRDRVGYYDKIYVPVGLFYISTLFEE